MKKVYAVVVTYNRSALLKRCLHSLEKQKYPVDKVIIIDNCSTDDTGEVVKNFMEHQQNWIIYHKLSENYGGAGGFYEGFLCASKLEPDWIVVMDDDAAPCEDYLQEIMRYAEKYKSIGCFIGTEYVGTTGRRAYGGRRRVADHRTLREEIVKEEEYNTPFFIDSFTFVGPVIKIEIVKKTGLPDKDFFIYYDDTDYSMRMRRHTEIMCIPSARINHRTDFEQDVVIEGQKEWRKFYMYRNGLMVKKRYIKNPFFRFKEVIKTYLAEVKRTLILTKTGQKSRRDAIRYILIVTRATGQVISGKLGKVEYINYDK